MHNALVGIAMGAATLSMASCMDDDVEPATTPVPAEPLPDAGPAKPKSQINGAMYR